MIPHFTLDFASAVMAMVLLRPGQSLLQLPELIFCGLRRRTFHDQAMHKCSLLRHAFLNFADVAIGPKRVVRSRHESLLTPLWKQVWPLRLVPLVTHCRWRDGGGCQSA